jgi:hypothetical protein
MARANGTARARLASGSPPWHPSETSRYASSTETCWTRSPAEFVDDRHNGVGFRPVRLHPGAQEHPGRTQPPGGHARHGGAHPESPGLVTRGADHAALGRRGPDDHRFAPQRRLVALLHRGEERVHIQMQDHPEHPGANRTRSGAETRVLAARGEWGVAKGERRGGANREGESRAVAGGRRFVDAGFSLNPRLWWVPAEVTRRRPGTLNVQRSTSNAQPPTSNVQRPTSNVQRPERKTAKERRSEGEQRTPGRGSTGFCALRVFRGHPDFPPTAPPSKEARWETGEFSFRLRRVGRRRSPPLESGP